MGKADGTRPCAVLKSHDIIRWRRYKIRHDNPRAGQSPAGVAARDGPRPTSDPRTSRHSHSPVDGRARARGGRRNDAVGEAGFRDSTPCPPSSCPTSRTTRAGGGDSAGPIATRTSSRRGRSNRGDEPAGTGSSLRATGAESVIAGGAGASSTGRVRPGLGQPWRRGGRTRPGRRWAIFASPTSERRKRMANRSQGGWVLGTSSARRHYKVNDVINGSSSS